MKTFEIPKIYIDEANSHYYIVPDREQCESCKEWIYQFKWVWLMEDYQLKRKERRSNSIIAFYCADCEHEFKPFGVMTQQKPIRIVQTVPEEVKQYFFAPPTLTNSANLSTFDIADINKMGGKTIDKTVLAGRESLEGATIGRIEAINDGKDELLDMDMFDNLLLEIKEDSSQTVVQIEQEKRKRLE